MVPQIERFRPEHLPQVQVLFNAHLNAVVPGWALPEGFIASRLQRNPDEYVVDPWVVERATLCAVDSDRVVAVTHLLRYGDGPQVSDSYQAVGEIAWLLAWPSHTDAATQLLTAARTQLADWQVRAEWAAGALMVPNISGVPDSWPHIAAVLRQAGFQPDPDREEVIYGGWLNTVPPPAEPPVEGLRWRRAVGNTTTRLSAVLNDRSVGLMEWDLDLTLGGALPALRGWADGWNAYVEDGWRNQGVGSWLVQHAAIWMRLGGCDRLVFPVEAADEAAGAGRFYRRFGWDVLARLERAWGSDNNTAADRSPQQLNAKEDLDKRPPRDTS